jgi:hypothetical protein
MIRSPVHHGISLPATYLTTPIFKEKKSIFVRTNILIRKFAKNVQAQLKSFCLNLIAYVCMEKRCGRRSLYSINVKKKKTYQFKHSVKDDQIIRQKLQISILLILEMVLHVIWNGASVDAK